MKTRNTIDIINAFQQSKGIDRSRPDLYIIDPKLGKWVLKNHVDMIDSILDEVDSLQDNLENKTDLEWWGEEEVKLWSSPNYGNREQELPEKLMKEALEKVTKKRVIVSKLSNMQLSCLARACVTTCSFTLWNRCINEMLARPDFVPERGTQEERSLINLLPDKDESNTWWEHVGEKPYDCSRPYKSSYSAYKSGTSPEQIKYKIRQDRMNLILDLLYKKVGVADEYEYIVAYGSWPFDVYYHNALLKKGEAYQGSVTRTI
jgi:hypothetical protein